MSGLLASPWKALALGAVAAGLLLVLHGLMGGVLDRAFWAFLVRWLHVLAAIVWVGLVWFVNFVQLPALEAADDQGRAVILRAIAPSVAWWFRHAATVTVLAGFLLAHFNGYLADALTLGALGGFAVARHVMIGTGMWLGLAMWAIVWFMLWPNLKIVLGLVPGDAEAKQAARRKVRNFARKNLILSIPVTFAMVSAGHLA